MTSLLLSPREPHRRMMGHAARHPLLYGATSVGVAEVASTRSDCQRLNLRREVRVGAWNVRSLRQDDRLPLLSRELGRLRVEVAALSEVRRPGSGTTCVGGYTYYWSGRSDGHHLQGVAIAVSSRLQPSVVEVTPVDERIMVLRLKLSFGFMSLIAVYAPTDVCKLDVKEMFYAKLTSVADRCPRRDIRIVLGDFNAVSGCDRAGYEMSVGPHGSGADAGSENSLLFRDFARSQKLRISGSWYQRPDPHRWTWYSDAGNAAKEIDHILVSTRWRILQNCRVYRSAEFCGTDHRLVVATLRVHFKTPQRSNDHPRVFHLDRLREGECARGFAEAISDRFAVLGSLTDPVLLWDTFKRETLDAAQDTIGVRPRAVQNSISRETLEATDACRAARLTGDRELHRSHVRRTRSLLRRDKEQFIRSLAEEVEGHFLVNDLRPAYQALRKLNSKPSSQVTAVRSVSGQIVSDPVAVRGRWAEYFEQLYQVDPPTVNLDAGSVEIPLPDPPISEDPPSLTEVRGAISKLKSGKAAGICGIPAELLKAGGEPMARGLHAVLAAIWQSGSVPPDLLRGVVIPLWKGKGDRWDCSNHRGITLLSVPGKVLAHILLRRIRDHLLRHQRLEQSGFTPGKSTIDRILALRVIVERRCEFGRGLLTAYIDLKKAFDTVHRESLWEILRLRGIPTRIIGLIASLYTGTESAVKCGGGLSSFFPVSSGVRQGCVLAPTLFNTCMDWILGRATVQSHCGATLGNIKVTDLDFADDVAILSESLETLVAALDAFSNEAKPLGLEVSWTKTKVQEFGDLIGEPVQSVRACGEDIEVTESFTYLGSVVHNSGLSDHEVSRRIGLAAGVMNSLNKSIWRCRYLCRRTKLRVFKALIMPVLLYGSETWTLSCALEARLEAFCNRSLRQIMGYCWRDHVSNQRLHRETGTSPVICTIRDRQLRLYGHLARFPQDDPAHQVVSIRDNPGWRRPVGRPRKSWLGQIDQTCREELEMGRVPAWRLAMRDPRRWKRRVDAAMHRNIYIKYTILTFLPKNLFEQFRRLANFYFLCLAFLHLSIDSPVSPLTSVLPLLFVVSVTGVKQAYEDWLRHREDNKVNNAPARVLREGSIKRVRWRDIAVGDIVEVADGEEIPADLLLLAAEDQEGKCVVTTANLDGETNLKTFLCPDATRNLLEPESLWSVQARAQCQLPHANLYDYKGVLEVTYQGDKSTASLATQNLLLRGAKLRHTPRVYGVAVYTGKETKMALNSKLKSNKFSTVEKSMNYFLIFFLFLLIFEVALCTILKYELYTQEVTNEMWYIDLPTNATVTAGDVYQDSISFLIIFSYIIPISLYVTLEMQKFLGTMFMSWDDDLRGDGEDEGARINTSDLNEELGQVQYLFTDKTGTLTENIMHFRNCSVDGVKYSDVAGEIQALDEQTNLTAPLTSLPVPLVTLLETLALCHTVQVTAVDRATAEQTDSSDTIELSELKQYQASSPDEKALVEACASYGVVFEGQNNGQLTVKVRGKTKFFTLLQVLEFDSDRKCMSVVVQSEADRRTWLLTKGAESSVLKRCLLSTPDQQRLHDVTLKHINDFAMLGLRTLAVARRELTEKQYEDFAAQLSQAKQVLEDREEAVRKVTDRMEADLNLLGATGVEDLLQDGVQETLESLRVAGIKVWVLTGDKVETAVNIAYSCGHFKRFMTILTLTGLHDKETADIQLQEYREACNNDGSFGLVVDGQSLVLLLEHFKEEFYAVGRRCWSVVCCRMSPKQKAEIVHMAKTSREHPICAAIGDGANDVSMIQEAHVGLGIMGKEGRQAVRCSDFGFAKFRFLKKMLLVHGHWNYVRVAVFVQFSFYKNVAFNTPIVFYSIWNAFSTQSLYESLALTAFNITFTSLPVLVYGLFEQNIPPDTLLTRPHLYQRNANNVAMSWLMFLKWNFFALWHAAAMFFGLWLTCWDDTCGLPDGATQDLYVFGLALGTLCTFVTNMKIVLEANFYNVVLLGSLVITTVGYAALYLLYSGIPVEPFVKYGIYAAYYRLFESPSLNLGCLVVGVACLLPDLVMKVVARSLDPEVKLWARAERARKKLRGESLVKVCQINEAFDADETSVSPDHKPEVL